MIWLEPINRGHFYFGGIYLLAPMITFPQIGTQEVVGLPDIFFGH